jgi:predicted 2-oxoglutarate/Fe(II)-dependent dioxygenase YbiX
VGYSKEKKKNNQRSEGTVKMTEKKPSHTPLWNIRLSFTVLKPLMKQGKSKWPKLFPKSDLQVDELLQGQIYTIADFFTLKECDNMIAYIESNIPLQTTPAIPKRGEALRSNDRISISDPDFAEVLWSIGIESVSKSTQSIYKASLPHKPAGLNSNIRIYRYTPGQRFECHYDDTVRDEKTRLWSEWTLLIYLTGEDEMAGGETVFYRSEKKKSAVTVKPSKGTALLHRHGASCLLHEAKEVTRGVKYVLRSDILVK